MIEDEDHGTTATDLADRMHRRLAAASDGSERPFRLQASTGVVWPNTEEAALNELIERADARMHEDKRARRHA